MDPNVIADQRAKLAKLGLSLSDAGRVSIGCSEPTCYVEATAVIGRRAYCATHARGPIEACDRCGASLPAHEPSCPLDPGDFASLDEYLDAELAARRAAYR